MAIIVPKTGTLKFTPDNPNDPIYAGKLDANGQMTVQVGVNLSLDQVIDAKGDIQTLVEEVDVLQANPSGPGTTVDLENIGNSGIPVFKGLVSGKAQLKKIDGATDGYIVVIDDPTNNIIRFTVDKAALGVNKVTNTSDQEKVETVGNPIYAALAVRPVVDPVTKRLSDTALPINLVYATNGKLDVSLLPDSVALPDIIYYNGTTTQRPAVGSSTKLYINETNGDQYRWNATSGAYVLTGRLYADVAATARGSVGVVAATSGLLTYNPTTGVFTSGFTQTLKDAYDGAVTKVNNHDSIIGDITPERKAAWDSNGTGQAVNQTPKEVLVTGATTTITYDPLQPNYYIVANQNTQILVSGIGARQWLTIRLILGAANVVVTFGGIMTNKYPATIGGVAQTQAYSEYFISGIRTEADLLLEATFVKIGPNPNVVAAPTSITLQDLGTGGIRVDWPTSPDPSVVSSQVNRRDYDAATATWGAWTPAWGPNSGNSQYAATEMTNLASGSVVSGTTQSIVPSYVASGKKYQYQVKYRSDLKTDSAYTISAEITKS